MPTFVLEHVSKLIGTYVIKKDIITIGRSRENTISIPNEGISRNHVRIERTPDGYVLTDLGSLNGTYINDKRIRRQLLDHGDKIMINTYIMTYKLEEEELENNARETARFSKQQVDKNIPAQFATKPQNASKAGIQVSKVEPAPYGPEKKTIRLPVVDTDQQQAAAAQTKPLQLQSRMVDSEHLVVLVTAKGNIDQHSVSRLKELFERLFGSDTFNVIMDLSGVSLITSTGWGYLVSQVKLLKNAGQTIKLANLQENVRTQFQLLALDKLMDACDSVDEALAAFVGGSPVSLSEETGVAGKPVQSAPEPSPSPLPPELSAVSSPPPPEHSAEIGQPSAHKAPVDKVNLSLEDKIKSIILENPLCENGDIRNRLAEVDYGATKIGRFKFQGLLKSLNLDTKVKRYQFFKMS
ncbi:MAG: FHA domain-containing protein [Chitinivibrionales bacterium]|nr:FHA domain-containing protein [Chitinivibrionales bacterium]